MKTILQSVRMLFLMTLLTGILYPILVADVAKRLLPAKANGSLILREGHLAGSSLLAQKCLKEDLFWPRPSACDYFTLPSGASNLGPTSAPLAKAVEDRKSVFGEKAPMDLLTASGSGLDPHLSPEGALWQIPRIAKARHIPEASLKKLVTSHIEPPQFGILGQARVNVLALNLALTEVR